MIDSFGSCLILSWILFTIGLLVLLTRRSIFTLLLALIVMFNGSSLAWIAAVRYHGDSMGQVMALGLLAVIASQFLIGLGVIASALRNRGSADATEYRYLRD